MCDGQAIVLEDNAYFIYYLHVSYGLNAFNLWVHKSFHVYNSELSIEIHYECDLVQVVIDSCCATIAEVQKRGKDFWAEFELYAADLLVGLVVDIALVGMLAPYTRFGQPSISRGLVGRIQHACAALPSRLVMSTGF